MKNARTIYTSKSTPIPSKKMTAIVAVVLVGALFFVATGNSSPTAAESKVNKSPTTTATYATTVQVSDALAFCVRGDSQFGGTSPFDCVSDSTTIHYEYLNSPEQTSEVVAMYGLKNSSGTSHFLRTGIIGTQSRLLALDTETLVVVNITSEQEEESLIKWWEN